MARRRISQREARRLEKRMEELEATERQRRNAWAGEWPGGVHLNTIVMAEGTTIAREVLTARKLGHAVVVVPNDKGDLMLFALPLR